MKNKRQTILVIIFLIISFFAYKYNTNRLQETKDYYNITNIINEDNLMVKTSNKQIDLYIERQQILTKCVETYTEMRDFELLRLQGIKLNEIIDFIEKQEIKEDKKFQLKQIVSFIYSQEKIGFSEIFLKSCLNNKSIVI